MLPSVITMIANENDREFMTRLFMQYRRLMFSEINKLVSNPTEAEDILQNALIKLCDKVSLLRDLDERRRISYIITAVKNQAKNHIRDNQKVSIYSLDDENFDLANSISDGTDIEQNLIIKEQLKELSAVWSKLDDISRQLLESKYLLKMNDEEIGNMLGTNPASVRMMLTRARRKALNLMTATEKQHY